MLTTRRKITPAQAVHVAFLRSQPLAGKRVKKNVPAAPAVRRVKLTPREKQIMMLLAAGHNAQEVADALFISVRTVHFHTNNVFGKCGVHTRIKAVNMLIAQGVLKLPALTLVQGGRR